MLDFIETHLFLLACTASGLSAAFTAYVIIDFVSFTSARYREKYISDAAAELEDVLLRLPPGRVLDFSLAASAAALFITAGITTVFADNPTAMRVVFMSVAAAVCVFPLPRVVLRYLKKRRLAKFNEQLEDALLTMSSSLKAGFSITQAMDAVVKENVSPVSYEFNVLLHEVRLGVPFDDALTGMSRRLGCEDFELVATAVITARQTGGELTGILDRLAAVIRERVRIQNKVRALTAQGRLQAWLIGLMPFLLMFALSSIAPDMMDAFFASSVGLVLIMLVIVLVITGMLIIRKITKIDI